jgi:hypothetical protein
MRIRANSKVATLSVVSLIIGLLPNFLLINTSNATEVSTTIASIYIDAPLVQGSYAMNFGGVTETFNNSSGRLTSSTNIGTITAGGFTVGTACGYGSSRENETATITANSSRPNDTCNSTNFPGSNFATADSGTVVTFSTAVKYVGFHWQAGNNGNIVTFRSGSADLASLTSTNIGTALVGTQLTSGSYASTSSTIAATDGTTYLERHYYGNPKFYTSLNQSATPPNYDGEPYAYVHAFAAEGESFDSIRLTGTGFELDNLVISTQEVPIRNSLILNQTATTNLTLGESNWNFKGVTTTDSSTVSTGWVSDSSTVVRSTQISIAQDLSIDTGTITMGRTALFRTSITNTASNTCGSTFTLVDSYTATDNVYRDILLADNGTASRDRLIRGFCYKWTLDPSSSLGTGAVRPTSSASGTRFNSNLESPMIVIPFADVESCAGAGSLVNGNFETLPDGLSTQASNAQNEAAIGTWHGYAANANPKQILFLYGSGDTRTATFNLNGWRTTATDGYIEIQRAVAGSERTNATQNADVVGVRPASGNFHAELAARQLSTLFQDVSTIPGTTIRFSVKHRARVNGSTDSMEVRIGSISSQTAQTVNSRRSPNNDVYAVPTYNATVDSGYTETSTISTTLANGWREYRGAYVVPTGQTTTRFAFAATAGSGSSGNLLDDIQFSPLIACPATLTVVAGRDVTIRPFDIDSSGNPLGNDSIDSYGWNDAFVTETLTASSGTVGRASVSGVNNRAITYTAPATVGQQTISFQIANPQGDFSRSLYTINVVADSRTRSPGDIPMDPRTTNYNFMYPQVTTATTRVLACVRQANSSGAIISGSLRFDVGTRGTSQTTINYGSESVTVSNDISNTLNITGPITAVNRALGGLWVTRSDTPARLSSRFYIHVSSMVTGLVLYSPTDCNNAVTNQIRVTTLRPITLTQTRRHIVTLKNGRQQG